ncbi:Rv3654c family TadE-like protein [Blastococcus sp. CCUG 61487]|uniref:Rv3654c family TadE-like protein n=1 Tax=Blastococcus sp. CCUG 61487 TaxID=1840703 RepID=UPI0010C0E729|nr:Rv3654c family TadE-like protein [Blastococcus sp. CCUG 61487]TKJ31952.1 hypothetical protein A6V29_17705 [Blastococcus sp. CCUG 61487]
MNLRDERGSATVWVLALAGVLAAVGLALVVLAGAVVARHRAGAAADLAALAAAGRAVRGDEDPCATAARIAAANGARLEECALEPGAAVLVQVGVPVELGPVGERRATARARAGP